MYAYRLLALFDANIVSEVRRDYVNYVSELVHHGSVEACSSCCIAPWSLPLRLFADAIMLRHPLTFIGAGIAEPTPTWGNIWRLVPAFLLAVVEHSSQIWPSCYCLARISSRGSY